MEKLKFIVPILLLSLSSCINTTPRYNDVNACFVVTGDIHYVDEAVNFVDCSQYAEEYEWNFGDGTTSNQRNPNHVYTMAGTYQVSLTAYGYNTMETFMDVVTVLDVEKTIDLDILVLYLGTTDPVSNCEVTIFDDEIDWEDLNFNNQIDAATTGNDGLVLFSDLNPIVYYIDAYKYVSETTYYSNYLQGYATTELSPDEENAYNVYVELLTNSKNKNRKDVEIKKIEKSSKAEHDRIITAFKLKQ